KNLVLQGAALGGIDLGLLGDLRYLTALDLKGTNLTPDCIRRLALSPWLAQITQLNLACNREIAPALRTLAEAPYLSPPSEPHIYETMYADPPWEALPPPLGGRLTIELPPVLPRARRTAYHNSFMRNGLRSSPVRACCNSTGAGSASVRPVHSSTGTRGNRS